MSARIALCAYNQPISAFAGQPFAFAT